MKKAISILLVLIFIFSLSVTVFAAGIPEGNGTERNPYIITTVEELDSLAAAVQNAGGTTVYAKLGSDITKPGTFGIRGSINLDFNNNALNSSVYYYEGSEAVLYNGTLNGQLHIYQSKANLTNLEIHYDSTYAIDSSNSTVIVDNCYVEAAGYYACCSFGSNSVIRFNDSTLKSGSYYQSAFVDNGTVYYGDTAVTDTSDPANMGNTLVVGNGYDPDWINTNSTKVTYSADPTYTVTIPERVSLGNTATVSAEDVVIEKGQTLVVTLSGTSADDNTFKLKTDEGAELTYTVSNKDKNIAVGDEVLTVNPDNSPSGSTTLNFNEPANAPYSGGYKGNIDFTISVANT